MDLKKFLIGTIVGGIVYFILGFLIYGLALMDVMASYSNPAAMRAEADMVWWALILGNLVYAGLISYVFVKWTDISSFGPGAMGGAGISFFVALSLDLMMYSYTTMMTDPTVIIIDVVAGIIMGAITGGAIGMVLGMGTNES
jgi:hypothetical protein